MEQTINRFDKSASLKNGEAHPNTHLGGPQTREQLGTATGAARIISLNQRGNGKENINEFN